MANYLEPIIKERRLNPEKDLISKLCSAKYEGIAMTDTDILALILNILLAATEPGDKTLALLIYNLINQPKQLQDVLNDRSLVPLAIAETLRYNPPVQLIPRQLSKDTEINGIQLSKGTTVFCMIGAANRDPNAFEKPDEFNIYRPDLDIKKGI